MNESSKSKILITGGCGKIGSYFARFAADKYDLRIADKVAWDTKKLGNLPGEVLVCDLQNPEACRKACSGMDTVIHLAANRSPKADFLDSLLADNIIAAYNVFRAAKEAGCKRFIYASSVHVIEAYPPEIQVKADMPVRPKNLYGVSKCFGEALAAYFAFNEMLPSIVLRIGAYVYPEEYEQWSFNERNSFISSDDLNELLIKCLETSDITFAIAHAISDNRIKRLDLAETKEILGYKPQADAFAILEAIEKKKKHANRSLRPIANRIVKKLRGKLKKITNFYFWKNKIIPAPIKREWPHSFTKPRTVCIDASSVCQLNCRSCPTASGAIAKGIGAGMLRFENFKKIIDENPWICEVELSNWGEIFLNPDLEKIMCYGYKTGVTLSADNGTNLNTVSEDVLKALVKYKFRSLTCSIDGASQEVYSMYRVNGNFDHVIENIRKINYYKNKYCTDFPKLLWQFVAFGHNEHEIVKARALARELNMNFYVKLSWNDLYDRPFSPIKDRGVIKKETGLDVADRQEYKEKYGKNYISDSCQILWLAPRIHFDGKLLGCCINHWGDYGNVLEGGLENCLNGEKINYAKKMLLGLEEAREDIPCSNCKLYKEMNGDNHWVKMEDLNKHCS
jgi:nucleoside-diphosphate-sugar epimerase/MoaA/NifB/PqqE/SkfB family radical SAM enzyme